MKSLIALALVVLFTAGCVVSQGPRTVGADTPDAAPDILIAFGDTRCGPCMRNKPTLQSWDASGRYEVIFLDGWMGTIPVPFYVVTRDGKQIFQTNNIDDL